MEQVWCYRKKMGPGEVTVPDQSADTLLLFHKTWGMALNSWFSATPHTPNSLSWGDTVSCVQYCSANSRLHSNYTNTLPRQPHNQSSFPGS